MSTSQPKLTLVPGGASGKTNAPDRELIRVTEAILFASAEPVSAKALGKRLPEGTDVEAILRVLSEDYRGRGIHLEQIGDGWAFRTAADLGYLMTREQISQKKLSRAALEILSVIAYHQPVTRADIEDVRGVEPTKGQLDVLLEAGWVRMRGRRKAPGNPITYGTTDMFLDQFGLAKLSDLPGLEELKGAGLLSPSMPSQFSMPLPPNDPDALADDEIAFDEADLEALGLLTGRGGDD